MSHSNLDVSLPSNVFCSPGFAHGLAVSSQGSDLRRQVVAAHARQHLAQAGIHFADVHAALADLSRIGGSHAQREVFEDTYTVACLRAGECGKAAKRLKMRLARRPSARDERWLAQAFAA